MRHKPQREPRPITLDEVMSLEPCEGYHRERVRDLMGGESISLAALERTLIAMVSPDDAQWLCAKILPIRERVLWAADCAERANGHPGELADEAIAAARACAEDPSKENRRRAEAAADSIENDRRDFHITSTWAARAAARAGSLYAKDYTAYTDALIAVEVLNTTMICTCFNSDDKDVEHRWQIQRACHYLRSVR